LKLLLDEMMQRSVAEQLRARGHDVVAVTERSELRNIPDADLFARMQEEGRTVVTYNRDDFLAIGRDYDISGRAHHGIVIVGPHRFPEGRSTGKLLTALEQLLDDGPPYAGFTIWLQ
jgi:hypothetical protein